jgi:hypothetical protein
MSDGTPMMNVTAKESSARTILTTDLNEQHANREYAAAITPVAREYKQRVSAAGLIDSRGIIHAHQSRSRFLRQLLLNLALSLLPNRGVKGLGVT